MLKKLPTDGELILTTLSILGAWSVRRSTSVIPSGTIGRLRRTVVSTPTTCTSSVAASTQAQTTATSTTGGWFVASLEYKILAIFNDL